MILKLARTQDGIITKQDVAELLMITPNQAYSEIKKLVSEKSYINIVVESIQNIRYVNVS